MRHGVLIAAIVLLPMSSFAQSQSTSTNLEILGWGIDVHGFLDVAYQSRYVWRGFDVYDGKSAVQFTGGVDFGKTGLGAMVQGHRANGEGNEKAERWDYSLYYRNRLFSGGPLAMDFELAYVYYNMPEWQAKQFDLSEGHIVLSWPQVTGIRNLVPRYALVGLWAPYGDSLYADSADGFAHIFMLDYSFSIPAPIPQIPEQIVNLHSEVVYNDGVSPDPRRPAVDHDWSDAVFGASTDFNLGYGITITPGVWYQVTMDRSVNSDENEFWVTVGGRFKF